MCLDVLDCFIFSFRYKIIAFFYNTAVCPGKCEGYHFNHTDAKIHYLLTMHMHTMVI